MDIQSLLTVCLVNNDCSIDYYCSLFNQQLIVFNYFINLIKNHTKKLKRNNYRLDFPPESGFSLSWTLKLIREARYMRNTQRYTKQ